MFARIVLVLNGVVYLGFGAVSLLSPETIAGPAEYILSSLAAFTEFRAFYGGYELGTGAFLLLCATRRKWWRIGLMASVLLIGGTGAGRIYGLITDGQPTIVQLLALSAEATATVLAVVALFFTGEGEATPAEATVAPVA
jgi:hypothetical protein